MGIFSVAEPGALDSAEASMKSAEFLAKRAAKEPSLEKEMLSMSSESLGRSYPLFASSLFSLIKNTEDAMEK